MYKNLSTVSRKEYIEKCKRVLEALQDNCNEEQRDELETIIDEFKGCEREEEGRSWRDPKKTGVV